MAGYCAHHPGIPTRGVKHQAEPRRCARQRPGVVREVALVKPKQESAVTSRLLL